MNIILIIFLSILTTLFFIWFIYLIFHVLYYNLEIYKNTKYMKEEFIQSSSNFFLY